MGRLAESGRADSEVASQALTHWQAQEQTDLPRDDGKAAPAWDASPDDRLMPSGWWLIPAVVLGITLWIALFRLIF